MLEIRVARLPASVLLRRAALAYLIVWVLSPPLAFGMIWRALAIVAAFAWLMFDIRWARSVLLRPNLPIIGVIAFVIYTLIIETSVPDSASVDRHIQLGVMLFFLLIGESLSRGRDGDARFCFWLVLLVLPIWMTTTLMGIEYIAADVARTISRSSDEARMLAGQGIGGYGFVYTVLLCLPFLAHFTMDSRARQCLVEGSLLRKRLARLLVALNFALACALLLKAGYSIALLLAGLSIALVVLVRSRRGLPFAISIVASGLLVLMTAIALPPALRGLESMAKGTEYEAKIRDLQESMVDGRSTGSVETRAERYERSLRLFLEHPLVGTLMFDDVGKHSAILDRFAQYGVVVGALFFFLIAYYPLRMLRDTRVPIGLGLSFAFVAIMFPMVNNVFMSWGLILYVFSRGALSVLGIQLTRQRSWGEAASELARA